MSSSVMHATALLELIDCQKFTAGQACATLVEKLCFCEYTGKGLSTGRSCCFNQLACWSYASTVFMELNPNVMHGVKTLRAAIPFDIIA